MIGEALSFCSGTLASVLANVLGDCGDKAASDKRKQRLDRKLIDDVENRLHESFEQEKVREWVFRQESRIREAGYIFSEEDKQTFISDFFLEHPELRYVHTRDIEAVILHCIDAINTWADDILNDEQVALLAVLKKDRQKMEKNLAAVITEGNQKLYNKIQKLEDRISDREAETQKREYDHRRSAYLDKIKNLYRIQNYRIRERNKYFIAEQKTGIIRSRALVIPIYSEAEELSMKDVLDIMEILGGEEQGYQYIHVISGSGFGTAHQRRLSPYMDKITVFDEQDIINEIMDFTEYLNDTIRQYELSNLYDHYIAVLDTNTGEELEYSVRSFLQETAENALLILGDYGCGKTSFLMNLAYQLAEEYLSGESDYIPLFIPLKEYTKAISMENLFLNLFVSKWHMPNVSIEAFKMMLQYVRFVLLFDGFDEVAKRVNYDVKFDIFNQICQFCNENTKIIVTCRPNYFQEKKEYEKLIRNAHLQFEPDAVNNARFFETYIEDLTPQQIHEYILSYETELSEKGVDIGRMEYLIGNTHDLTDLSRRPFLLNIIVQTLPEIISDIDSDTDNLVINAASLYRNYTDLWLDRENAKGKALIRKEDKLHFCMHIAYKMFMEDTQSIHFSQMPEEIKEYFPDLHQMDAIDYFSHDIQSCSFMNSEGDGYFKFIHKSFMEYFVARFIIERLQKSKGVEAEIIHSVLSIRNISTEIALFINDILHDSDILYQQMIGILERQMDNPNEYVRQNAVTLLSKMDYNMAANIEDNMSYTGGDFSYSTIRNQTIYGADFSRATFYGATIKDVTFIECDFTNTVFQKASLENVDFSYQSLEYADMSYCTIIDCSFTEGCLAAGRISHSYLRHNDFMECDMSGIEAYGTEYERNLNCDSALGAPYELH